MKNRFILILLILLNLNGIAQNVGIGTSTPDNSSILDINSSDKGLLISRMTETERLNIINPAKGLSIYQTNNTEGLYYFDGASWLYIGNADNDPWKRNTANSSVNTAFLSDSVGIGTSSPSGKTDVRGYMAANNFFTIIPLWKGTTYTINNNSAADVPNCETGIIPGLFEKNGNLQVKLIIRATSKSGTNNNFQLRVHNGTNESYPIVNTDTWTWGSTGGGETVTSPWKDWNAGTSPYEIHLNAWAQNSGDYVTINAVYLVVRSKQQ